MSKSKKTATKPKAAVGLQWIHQTTNPLAFNVRPIKQDDDLYDVWILTVDGELERHFAAEEISKLPSLFSDLTDERKFCFATLHVNDEELALTMQQCLAAFQKGGQR